MATAARISDGSHKPFPGRLGPLAEGRQRDQMNEQSSIVSEWDGTPARHDGGNPFGSEVLDALLCIAREGEEDVKLLNVRLVSAARISDVEAVMPPRLHAVGRAPAPRHSDDERDAATAEAHGPHPNTHDPGLDAVANQRFHSVHQRIGVDTGQPREFCRDTSCLLHADDQMATSRVGERGDVL